MPRVWSIPKEPRRRRYQPVNLRLTPLYQMNRRGWCYAAVDKMVKLQLAEIIRPNGRAAVRML